MAEQKQRVRRFRWRRAGAMAALLSLLAACGGSGSPAATSPPPPPPAPVPITKAEAFRFLNQATFGATEAEADRLIAMGYSDWLDAELAKPASLQLPYVQSLPVPAIPVFLQADRAHIWAENALHGPDQLRQRVAFALSEIMVVSQLGALQNSPYGLASYYDLLATHAFGNFRDLIEAVTLHPSMGVYLSMLGNQKPNAALNIRPDENYARELMQLFTIGLVELEQDGRVRLDGSGQPIPTYTQEIIEGFAHVYTGWHYAGAPSFRQARVSPANQVVPMQLYPDYHDFGPKLLLNGTVLPAGLTGEQDLDAALDNIFNHPNVGPFIAERLIQRLVTSNPSPAFISRVAGTFNDNGRGVRGDLRAVVRAILLDSEARPAIQRDTDGKLREPLLRLTQLWRAFDARSASGQYPVGGFNNFLGQGPLQSPSVFNFFSPFYAPAGEIRDRGLVAPEMQIATEFQNTGYTNLVWIIAVLWASPNAASVGANIPLIDIDEELALAPDIDALIDRVAGKLLGGQISPALRTELAGMLARFDASEAHARAAEAIYLIATSPEFVYQR